MTVLKGIGASEGIGIGRVFLKKDPNHVVYTGGSAPEELDKLSAAVASVKLGLEELAVATKAKLGASHGAIFEAHLMMLEDPEYTGGIRRAIEGGQHAVAAVEAVTQTFVTIFDSMPDPYLKERAIDIADIGRSLTATLKGVKRFDPTKLHQVVLVAEDLTPSDTALLSPENIMGIVTAVGGSTSHSAIIAKSLGIPAVMGVKDVLHQLAGDELVVVDGGAGQVLQALSDSELETYKGKQAAHEAYVETLKAYLDLHTVTTDGKAIEVSANIAKPAEAKTAFDNGAEGIGLFRSEFIFMDRDSSPTEDEQFEAYKEALTHMKGKPVIIRTMDIGGDKQVSYLAMEKEENPFLGYRAVRYCLDHTDFFKTQLRALLRASLYGKLRIMVPMIATVAEVRAVKALLEMAKSDLYAEGYEVADDVELGIMIEIPAAALKARALAKEVDFFSIGTNDLTQYTLAVDRMNANLADLYNPMDPAVLSLIQMTIDAAHAEGKWVGMCGNASGNPLMIPILVGMGLDEFSVSPKSVTAVRKAIMGYGVSALKKLASEVLDAEDVEAVEKLVKTVL